MVFGAPFEDVVARSGSNPHAGLRPGWGLDSTKCWKNLIDDIQLSITQVNAVSGKYLKHTRTQICIYIYIYLNKERRTNRGD